MGTLSDLFVGSRRLSRPRKGPAAAAVAGGGGGGWIGRAAAEEAGEPHERGEGTNYARVSYLIEANGY